MKVFIVIDMQNDFVTGSLANKEAEKIVPRIVDAINNQPKDCKFYCTYDTHDEHYLNTLEGHNLPVVHCVDGTDGWEYVPDISEALAKHNCIRVYKDTFTAKTLLFTLFTDDIDEIELCGTCTDICVVSNAILLRGYFPNTKITVNSSLCAGTTPDNHEAALTVMRSCQIEVV